MFFSHLCCRQNGIKVACYTITVLRNYKVCDTTEQLMLHSKEIL